MIAHVAEAAENSGRVVFKLAAANVAAPVALAAAVHVAQSFSAGLESLFVEDPQLLDFASFDFAREVQGSGGLANPVSVASLESSLESLAAAMHGEVASAAAGAGVPVHCRTLRDDPAAALAAACSENGPWNVAVLGAAVSAETEAHVSDLVSNIQDVTGFVVASESASRTTGPVVAIVEKLAHVQPLLRAAERLAARAREDVHLILFAGNADENAWMDGQVRLLLGSDVAADLILSPDTAASPEALAGFLHVLGAGFVIAQLGGALLPLEGGLAGFAASHEGPLFLIR